MRRFLLMLTVISFSAWSQPAQQQAQAPNANVRPANSTNQPLNAPNPWTQIGNLAPGIITALSVLVAVWLTQRYQLRLEFHKAELAAKYKSQDNRWAFRKDVYVNLVNSLTTVITCYDLVYLKANEAQETPDISHETNEKLKLAFDQFMIHVHLASLATAEEVDHLVQNQLPKFVKISETDSATVEDYADLIQVLVKLRQDLCAEGRRELWGTPEPEARAGAAT